MKENPFLSGSFCLELVHHILSNMESSFVERRGIELFEFLLTNFSYERHLKTRSACTVKYLLHEVAFPFQKKRVLGLLIELQGSYGEIESLKWSFLDRHQELLIIEHSSFPFIQFKENRTFLYFEVQKREGHFSPDEADDLLGNLEEIALALASRWKAAIPSLESSFKILRWLMNEVEAGDLPHVLIDLCEQASNRLSFFVLLSEVKTSGSPSFVPLLSHPDIEQKMRLAEGGKEGIVLKIDLSHSPTLSLIEGRKKVSALIEECLGPFRDVNGGLLENIEKNFQALAQTVPKSNAQLRNFFDSITPEETRAIFDPFALREIYFATKKTVESNRDFTIIEQEGWIAAVIQLDKELRKQWEASLLKALQGVSFSHLTESNQWFLNVFLLTSSDEQKSTFKEVTQTLFDEWQNIKKSTQVLRLCTTSHFTSFDPRTGPEEETSYLHKMLFEGLMRINPSGSPEPAIAEKVKISEDGKSYRFFLRQSKWSNGMSLTAHDFLYSWKMILLRKDLAPLSYLFDCIKHAKEIKERTLPIEHLGARAIDDYTLDIELLSPCNAFLEMCALTLFFPICQTVDERHPSWSEAQGDNYVCNGPFALEKKEPDGEVVLKKNPLYWQADKIRLERVEIPLVSQEEAKNLFLSQQVDALFYYFYKNPSEASIDGPNIQSLEGGTFLRYLCFDCSTPPFHSQKVRKAIALAINKEQIARYFSKDATANPSFYSPERSLPPSQANLTQDTPKARLLLIEAIAEDPEVYRTLFNQILHVLENTLDLGRFICSQINEALGVNWDVCTTGLSTKYHSPGVRLYGWADRVPDPGYFLGTFSKTSYLDNPAKWINPQFQSLTGQLTKAQTQAQKDVLFRDAEKVLWEELPMIPLFYIKTASLYHAHIHGLHGNSLQQFDIRFAFKEEQSTE